MASVNMADVKRLREITAAGMMYCKKALEEADGDFDRAVELLRLKGAKDVGKREARTASNGLVALKQDGDSAAALLELNCETDFVAKAERFQELAGQVVAHILATKPADVAALLESSFDGKTVKEHLDEANVALGEKIEIRRFAVLEGGYVGAYMHKTDPRCRRPSACWSSSTSRTPRSPRTSRSTPPRWPRSTSTPRPCPPTSSTRSASSSRR